VKAVLFQKHGNPDVLSYSDFPDPSPTPDQILVEIKAVALNHLDLFVRKGVPGLKLKMPHILGSDISGVIADTGENVSSKFEIGQRIVIDPSVSCNTCEFCIRGEESLCPQYQIIGEHIRGGYAQFISVNEENIVPVPDSVNLDFEETAAVPLTFMTAWRLMITKARIRPGDDILIIGIGGGVALAAMQIAKIAGARVFVTSSSNEKLEKAQTLGADGTINYIETPEFQKEVFQMTDGRGVDTVFDSVGEATWDTSLRCLRKGGRLVTCGATSGPNAVTNVNRVFWRQLEILGSTMASRAELRDVLKLVWTGKLKPVIDRVIPLEHAKKAHEALEHGEQFGKIVLRV
jgi:NADPH:quinone reductase-like Zn-dependent oxidoreductase